MEPSERQGPKPTNSMVTLITMRALRMTGFVFRRTLEVLLALVVLFEEWGWRPLVELIGRLRRFRIWAAFEGWIASLPPYGALLIFALPSALLFPLKLLALWLIAQGKALAAGALFLGAKVVGTAFVARIFLLTRPALLRIGWFRWVYERFVPWQEAIFATVRASWAWRYGRMVKARVKQAAKRGWLAIEPSIRPIIARLRALVGGRGSSG
jgi:hypothetical protein